MAFSAASPAFARPSKRKSRPAKAAAAAPALEQPAFTSILEVTGGPEPDLRDAPGPEGPGESFRTPAPVAAPVAAPRAETLLERLVSVRNAGPRRIDADACYDAARNLRFMVSVAKGDLREGEPAGARRKLASGLKREPDVLQRSQPHDDSEIQVLATEAEMELESALKELEAGPLGAGTLAAASRAAAQLESAARLLGR